MAETLQRAAIVGTGARAETFTRGIADRDTMELVALCDTSAVRMAFHNRILTEGYGKPAASTWAPEDFSRMLKEERIDLLVVASVDATHDGYIVEALDAGLKVVTEKPMVTDAEKARRVLDAADRSTGSLSVAFNYRFNPVHAAVHDILAAGEIGEINSVHFEYLLDTHHGADYFRRWHRLKENSGGLIVHKSGHHFDLVNWWIGAAPTKVYGVGRLAFYGQENGERTGNRRDYVRAHGSAAAAEDPFALQMASSPALTGLYLDAEEESGYVRDRNVFNPDIDIEDDMAVLVTFDSGASMTYHLTAYAPWEGYRVMFNGSKGRLELEVEDSVWTDPSQGNDSPSGVLHGEILPPNYGGNRITVRPLWGPPRAVDVEPEHGGHGGADQRLLAALLDDDAPLADYIASPRDGVNAQVIGFAANESFATGQPVLVAELLER